MFAHDCVTRLDAGEVSFHAREVLGQLHKPLPTELQGLDGVDKLLGRAVHGAAARSRCRVNEVVAGKLEGQLDSLGQAPRVIGLQGGDQLFQW